MSGMRRLVCRTFGHKWVWVRGWIECDCARCGMTHDQHREELRAKGILP